MRTVVSRTMQAVKTAGRCEGRAAGTAVAARQMHVRRVRQRAPNECLKIRCVVGGVPDSGCGISAQPPKQAVILAARPVT